MFDLNPFNNPDVPVQHGIMLLVAGLLGLMIGYVSRRSTIRQLESALISLEQEVEDCQRIPIVATAGESYEEAVVLNRIRARAHQLNFDRIGRASAAEADNLKMIGGIGPFLEKKLHAIGIYTYRQLANLTTEDIRQVNDIIEFFPGRIERDDWVGQAAELLRK